ncbi:MarR family transcriptional regulator [Paenibacillus sp. ACRRY]|uniref:MarR family winged helix-turn-helix transcriptional regulator n=1 Tax=Paenibacillus sp. ACRRY TaxID=2918208 RepID=UPI001EF530AB|nr:MarR family transcriptional regulator [Paenibacillus sp. ACRRY]MCG7383734.1 MarR family transcriptional regulator [Paenibacillus sp. ACRRY]
MTEKKEVLREIGMIARCLDSISNVEFQHLNLSRGQYLYLYRICENPGIIPNQLAEMIKVDRTTAARAISKLEADGFIVKKSALGNKKNKQLYPTEAGLDAWAFIQKEGVHSDQVTLEGLTEEEIELAVNLLRRMRHNIEVDWKFVKKGGRRAYMNATE